MEAWRLRLGGVEAWRFGAEISDFTYDGPNFTYDGPRFSALVS